MSPRAPSFEGKSYYFPNELASADLVADVMECQAVLFEWADSFDAKDWQRLQRCIAPTLRIDYREIMDKLWESMPSDDFVKMASDPGFVGGNTLRTQHFIGQTRWEQESDDKIVSHQQMRVAHQRYTDDTCREVTTKGHAHGTSTVWYTKVDGEWKFSALIPLVRWTEYDYEKIFQ